MQDISKAKLDLDPTLNEIIKVDVLRTFTLDSNFPRNRLLNILECGTVALLHGASYCQGMNYMAGLLYYLSDSDEEIFQLYVSLIENKMTPIFNSGFQKLKSYFYVLDNLMHMYIPDRNEALKVF